MDSSPSSPKPTLLERLSSLLLREPEDREQLLALLHSAFERDLLDADAMTIIEGAMAASETSVRDVMVPRAQMGVIDIDLPLEQIIPKVIEAAHSRFPVVGESKDDVIGILLAKDLLRTITEKDFHLRDWLRPAVFIPESKRLNVLLREFRVSRNHMAIVVDEFGGVCGLVTIEDVIEQIVGDIEDEHDIEEGEDDIVPVKGGRFRVKATTELEDFNSYFDTGFVSAEVDTIGGLLLAQAGHLPKRGDVIELDPLRFTIMRADSRRLHLLLVEKPRPATTQ